MKAIVSAMSVMLAVCILDGVWAATWYVDGSAPKPGDGTSWEKAVKKIQAGIDKAANGDTVVVAQGTYVENVNFKGKNIVLRSTNPTDWAVVKQTIIDGNKAGSVVTFYGTEDETCVLSGFTIRNGTGTLAPDGSINGGGIIGTTDQALPLKRMTRAAIRNNIITGNSGPPALGNAAGIGACAGLIENCIITGNSVTGPLPNGCGGGIGFCNGIIQNNLIVGNSAECGGALSFCNAVFRNNAALANTCSGGHGAGLAHHGRSSYTPAGGSITNCIIWGNTAPAAPQVGDSVAPSHCCIQDWTGGGEGNTPNDPRFLDPDGPDNDPNTYEDNDYRLSPSSRCIDAGINEDWMNGATDLHGNPRILLGATAVIVDIGAYEYRFAIGIARNTETDVELSWTMRASRSYTVLSSSDMMLQPWAEETTILGGKTGGLAVWVDPGTSSPLKFYRVEIE